MGLKEAVVVADIVQKTLASLALLIAGFWAYYKYFRGRIYHERLEPELSGVIRQEGEIDYLVVTVKVKNVGLSRVPIQQKGSGLRVFTGKVLEPHPKLAREIEWELVATLSILEEHAWVEPGESVYEQLLLGLPKNNSVAAKLALQLVSAKQMWCNTTVATQIETSRKGSEHGRKYCSDLRKVSYRTGSDR